MKADHKAVRMKTESRLSISGTRLIPDMPVKRDVTSMRGQYARLHANAGHSGPEPSALRRPVPYANLMD